MKKKRNWLPKILTTIVILGFVSFMIWWIVNLTSPKADLFTLGTVVKENKIALRYNILSAQEEVDGNMTYVTGFYTSKEAGVPGSSLTTLDAKGEIRQYRLTITTEQWHGEYEVLKDPEVPFYVGDPSDDSRYNEKITVYQYFLSNVNGSLTRYSFDGKILTERLDAFGWQTPFVTQPNAFLSWLPTIIYILILVFGGFFLVKMLSGSVNGANKNAMDFNKSRARRVEVSTVHFIDVAGCEEEKQEMSEIVDYLKQPKKYAEAGAKIPKGVLLVGAPGTGKTLLAKAVAGEAGVPFFSISGSDFVEMFVGVGAGRVRDMFKTAKQNAPCIIFIDEIDAVGRQRGAGLGGGNDEREQTLNQLLVEMDGFADNAGIIVIAATNRDDVLDPALLRAGRFDRKITVSLPDLLGREAIFKVHARNKKVDSNVDFHNIAKRTVGFSGADIASVLNDAAILSVRNKTPLITLDEIDEAIDRRIAGPAKSSRALSDLERRTVAFHEAGHAIIGLKLKSSDKVQKITIVPRGNTGGHVLMTPENDRFLMTKSELMARITGYLGGRTSEEIFFEDVSTGASNDIEVATRIARAMVVEYGMSKLGPIQYEQTGGSVFLGRDYASTQKNFSQEVALEIDKEVRNIVESCHDEARRIIKENEADLRLIAETLLERESITSEQIDYLLTNRTLEGFNQNSGTEVVIPPVAKDTVVEDQPVNEEKAEETKAEETKESDEK